VLELGAARTNPMVSTSRAKAWVPRASLVHGTDIRETEDVDFTCDVHFLSIFAPRSYDLVISCSGFEHFKYPHLVGLEISRILNPGGAVFIQTHHCFPLHAYPYDYFRFSTEALAACFGSKNGIEVVSTGYDFEAEIRSARIPTSPDWLNTHLFGIKTGMAPERFVYEFDVK
jgi:SAM-dependent methyltransferase